MHKPNPPVLFCVGVRTGFQSIPTLIATILNNENNYDPLHLCSREKDLKCFFKKVRLPIDD